MDLPWQDKGISMTKITVKMIKACKVVSTQGIGFAGIKTIFKESLVPILANGYEFSKPAGIFVDENDTTEASPRYNCVYKACIPVKGRPDENASTRLIEKLPPLKNRTFCPGSRAFLFDRRFHGFS